MKKRVIYFALVIVVCIGLAIPMLMDVTAINANNNTEIFSVTVGPARSGMLEQIREITVESFFGGSLEGLFLVTQVSVPGRGLSPTITAIQLRDMQREVITISFVHPNSIIDVVLVEGGADFLDPRNRILAYADTR